MDINSILELLFNQKFLEKDGKLMVKNYLAKVRANQMSAHKGFTLVELIVVIVILAILVGVTIGGIYMYVGKSKVNTDKNNASSIVSVCGTANADEKVYAALLGATVGDTVTYTWSDPKVITPTPNSKNTVLKTAINEYMKSVLPDGLPKVQQDGKQFKLTFTVVGDDDAKSLSVTCVVEPIPIMPPAVS